MFKRAVLVAILRQFFIDMHDKIEVKINHYRALPGLFFFEFG
jgi:hypothetical protein